MECEHELGINLRDKDILDELTVLKKTFHRTSNENKDHALAYAWMSVITVVITLTIVHGTTCLIMSCM